MNPIKRLDAVEADVQALKARIESSYHHDPNATPIKIKTRIKLVMPLSPQNRELALFAWATLINAETKTGSISQGTWYKAIKELDTDNLFPSQCSQMGATLRATLAEEAGMGVRWSSSTLWGQNEIGSAHYNRAKAEAARGTQ